MSFVSVVRFYVFAFDFFFAILALHFVHILCESDLELHATRAEDFREQVTSFGRIPARPGSSNGQSVSRALPGPACDMRVEFSGPYKCAGPGALILLAPCDRPRLVLPA